ncbi:hypothetical protein KY362_00550 [Candidatus Woesearchaeota archaeon]|nr:hypothetical protein [Candidatus Woesearchaeota archaeon]
MAKKSDTDFSKAKNFRELDSALKHSFVNIKNDITALKEGVHRHGVKIAEVGREVKDSQADFVTVDKFNILKIKIGELNENMKKVWDIEKKLEDVDRKSVAADEFDKQNVSTANELEKLRQDLDELDSSAATEDQTKDLVRDINEEFDKIKKAIEELRSIKDTITRAELEKRTEKLYRQADDLGDGLDKLKADLKTKVSLSQVEALVNDVNSEFDRLKESIAAVKEGEDRFALHSHMERELDKLDSKISKANQNLSDIISDFSKGIEASFKDLVRANQKKLDDMEKTIELVDRDLASEIEKSHNALARDLDKRAKKLQSNIDSSNAKLKAGMDKTAEKLQSDLDKEVDSLHDKVDDNAEKLGARISALNNAVSEQSKIVDAELKTLVKKKQVQNLIDDLNKEFDAVKDDVDVNSKELDLIKKGFATKEMVDSELRRLNAKLDNTAKDISAMRKDAASHEEVGGLFDELRARLTETNRVLKERFRDVMGRLGQSQKENDARFKDSSADVDAVAKGVRKQMRDVVAKKDLHSELDVVREEFEKLHTEIGRLSDDAASVSELDDVQKQLVSQAKSAKKEFVSRKHFEKLLKQVARLNEQLEDQSGYLSMRDKQLKELTKELKVSRKAEKRAEKELARAVRYEAVVEKKSARSAKAAKKQAKPVQENGKGKGAFFANFLVGAAFVVLIAAVVFFFTGLSGITDILAIAAVVCFVLGIIIRIVVAFRE